MEKKDSKKGKGKISIFSLTDLCVVPGWFLFPKLQPKHTHVLVLLTAIYTERLAFQHT